MTCLLTEKIKFIFTDALLFYALYLPRTYKCEVKRLKLKTHKNTQITDVKKSGSCGKVVWVASILITSFVPLWKTCVTPNWLRSGNLALL